MLGHGGGAGGGAAATGWDGGMEIDGAMLAGAGYHLLRSSDIYHVAHRPLATVSDADSPGDKPRLAGGGGDALHYNPTDLAAWVDSMLYDLDPADLPPPPPAGVREQQVWPPPPLQNQTAAAAAAEEDSGIQLVHLLMSCAEAIQHGDAALAGVLFEGTRTALAGRRVNTDSGIGKVAMYFADALGRRIYAIPAAANPISPAEDEIVYRHFYEAAPYIKFAHIAANQVILDAFHGSDRVHVVDLGLTDGGALQWPVLIQALALRPGGPPSMIRLTGIGPPPSTGGRDPLNEVGLRLAEIARSVGVRFAFHGVAARRADEVRPWMLRPDPCEAVAVNSVMQLHRLLGDPPDSPVESVLGWIRELRPRIVTVAEQEADHNRPAFVDRFTEALFFYSTIFDSLEDCRPSPFSGGSAEVYLQRQICDIVCSDGAERTERHEPLQRWMARLGRAGFRQVRLSSEALERSRMVLNFGEGYFVEEVDGCLALGWHGRRLVSASAWRPADDGGSPESVVFNSVSLSDGLSAAARQKNKLFCAPPAAAAARRRGGRTRRLYSGVAPPHPTNLL